MKDQSWFQVHTLDGEELNICLDHAQGFGAKTHIQNARQVNGSVVYSFGVAFVVNESLDEVKLAMKNAGPIPLDVPKLLTEQGKPKGATVVPNPVAPPAPPKEPKGTTTTSGQLLGNMKTTVEQQNKTTAPVDPVTDELKQS